ncbi:15369_t:CDS:2 [Cetraspora pellucida]|uniref:15369_t:CDS:1 n=1 Tax=Cetraspora pellucida TaxID=1433469 RepID=A0A9N9NRU6_9GLOM|nr:15369_t:CDS:2 [Cetraspora pellucida]
MSSSEEDTSISASTTDKDKKNIDSCPYSPVWEYFTKGEKIRKKRYKATSNSTIIKQFLIRILSNNSEKNESNKKRKSNIQEN